MLGIDVPEGHWAIEIVGDPHDRFCDGVGNEKFYVVFSGCYLIVDVPNNIEKGTTPTCDATDPDLRLSIGYSNRSEVLSFQESKGEEYSLESEAYRITKDKP